MKTLRRSHTSAASSSSNALSSSPTSSSASSSWVHLRSLLIIASSPPTHDRVILKSPWSRRKRKRPLSLQQWIDLLSPDGKLQDKVKFLKRVRSGGIEPRIRAEVWPFLLGVYDLTSTEAERNAVKTQRRKEYIKLRRHCQRLLMHGVDGYKELKTVAERNNGESPSFDDDSESPSSEDVYSARQSVSIRGTSPDIVTVEQHAVQCCLEGGRLEEISSDKFVLQANFTKGGCLDVGRSDEPVHYIISPSNSGLIEEEKSSIIHVVASTADAESSDSESSIEDPESMQIPSVTERSDESYFYAKIDSPMVEPLESHCVVGDYATWQRIIRLDAIRTNAEWVPFTSTQTMVSEDKAYHCARTVRLKDYDHLEPCRIYHAARLVSVLEAYAVYDPEIGYCQGMSDLLSPIVAVIEDDSEAFWCFVAFMRKARNNFRLDELGIRRQLNIVSKIIKHKDSLLYRHLQKLQAEDCFFVYRMVVVLFRRELSFEQTSCLWEVMWADQAAIRAGIGKSAWGRIRQRAPPTDDLLLYAIAACVLQKRKLIMEKYSSMDEILRECNSMSGQLDVWRLLDDAHDLVVTLHDKI